MVSNREREPQYRDYFIQVQWTRDAGHAEDALELYETAARLAKEAGDEVFYAEILHQQGVAYAELGNVENAHRLYDDAITAFTVAKNREGIGNTLRDKAMLYFREGDNEVAQARLKLSIEHLRGTKEDPHGLALTIDKLAVVLASTGRSEEAEIRFREALTLSQEAGKGNWWARVTVCTDYSRFLYKEEEYEEAYTMALLRGVVELREGIELEEKRYGRKNPQNKRFAQLWGIVYLAGERLGTKDLKNTRRSFEFYLNELSEEQREDVLEFLGGPEIG